MSPLPSLVPSTSLAPSLQPSEDFCLNDPQMDKFEMLMTPDSTLPTDIIFRVFIRENDGTFSRRVFARFKYETSTPDQSDAKCLYKIRCYKVELESRSEMGLGDGSYQVYWHGKYYVVL